MKNLYATLLLVLFTVIGLAQENGFGQIHFSQPDGAYTVQLIIYESHPEAPPITDDCSPISAHDNDEPFAGFGNENLMLSKICGVDADVNLGITKIDPRNKPTDWQYIGVRTFNDTSKLELNFQDSVWIYPKFNPTTKVQYYNNLTETWDDINFGLSTIAANTFIPESETDSLGYRRILTVRIRPKQKINTGHTTVKSAVEITSNHNNTVGFEIYQDNQLKSVSGTVEIFNVLGQLLETKQFENGNVLVTNLNSPDNSTNLLIARFTLSNGEIITKKVMLN